MVSQAGGVDQNGARLEMVKHLPGDQGVLSPKKRRIFGQSASVLPERAPRPA